MDEELQELRDLVAQLQVDNERLRQQWALAAQDPNIIPAPPNLPSAVNVASNGAAAVSIAERMVFIPRERTCPIFSGKSGQRLSEWLEEAQASIRVRHLAANDQADFLYDHLEGEARDEIKYRPSVDRRDPARIIAILRELYGCTDSYVVLQEAFFSRKQQEGETLQEFRWP